LATLTTYPPTTLNGMIAQDTTLRRTALRDADEPDLGYHYPPLDYFTHSIWITNSTVTVAPGVAIGVYATNYNSYFATTLPSGSFICEGRADNPNRIAVWQLVQEQVPTNFTIVPYLLYAPFAYSSPLPGLMRVRFTEISAAPAATGSCTVVIQGGLQIPGAEPLAVLDSKIYGGRILLWDNHPIALTNNLLFRVQTESLFNWSEFRNNTFYGGSVSSYFTTTNGGYFDNIFDSVLINPLETPNDFNGYTTNCVILDPPGSSNVMVSSIAWETGPLGDFYLPTNSPFVNAGSRNADVAGLYHFTTTAEGTKETNSVVDLGFHYAGYNIVPFTNTIVYTNVSYLTNVGPATNTTIVVSAPGLSGQSDPYPAQIVVSNVAGVVTNLKVTLTGITHTFPDDIDILLMSPSGKGLILMADAGGGLANGLNNVTITLDDAAATVIPDTNKITAGSYRCGNYAAGWDPFPQYQFSANPLIPFGVYTNNTTLAAFNGENPNGIWSLYVVDDSSGDVGTIKGWSLNIAGNICTNAILTTITTNRLVITNSAVVPVGLYESDGDGVFDYEEDSVGNGSVDNGETDWRNRNDLGLRVFITRPRRSSPLL
jgi:subtilisin-like proprotein convertase family protein